jgi:ATP adenylyltransferase
MDRLWSPWRYAYVSEADSRQGCIFCDKPAEQQDRKNFILYRARLNYVLLNLYPYTTGHLMIAPYQHVATLEETPSETLQEMILLAREAERALRAAYRPAGFNLGMNLGECAGAGVAGHIHLHVVPRWPADSNFMTTVGETRVLPETLEDTYEKLIRTFGRAG